MEGNLDSVVTIPMEIKEEQEDNFEYTKEIENDVMSGLEIKEEQEDVSTVMENVFLKEEANPLYLEETVKEEIRDSSRYVCLVCNEQFARLDQLRGHLFTHNRREEPFKYNVHKKSSLSKLNVQKHNDTMHDDARKKWFKCAVCSKSFFRFKCDVCESTFLTGKRFRVHKWMHDNAAVKDDFKGDVREKLYSKKDNVRAHDNVAVKEDFKCDACKYKDDVRAQRQMHAHVKSANNKRFQCDVCEKTFSSGQYMRKHKRGHEKTVEPKSDVCPEDSSNL